MHEPTDTAWMQQALDLAARAEVLEEVPVGAVIVKADEVIGTGFNRVITDRDPTAHAEIIALRQAAGELNNYRLPGATLYVTLEPCAMCAGALVNARIDRVVYATADPRTGAHESVFEVLDNRALNHRCRVTAGVLADEAGAMLRDFFRKRR